MAHYRGACTDVSLKYDNQKKMSSTETYREKMNFLLLVNTRSNARQIYSSSQTDFDKKLQMLVETEKS